jgi:hypothetical protein
MSEAILQITGGCLCGAVRYQLSEPPIEGGYCHCSRCRRAYGGLFLAGLRFPGRAFALTSGDLQNFEASVARRSFCAACGSPIAFAYQGADDVWILVGSLDRPEQWPLTSAASFGPVRHLHVDSRVSWFSIADDLPKLDGTATPFLDAARARQAPPT